MKKLVLVVSAFALVLAFSACGGPKADGKKYAEKECECQKLRKEWKADRDNESKKEKYHACKEERKALEKELEKKYGDNNSEEDMKAFLEGVASVECDA